MVPLGLQNQAELSSLGTFVALNASEKRSIDAV